jgi:pimeloyl-ACP methyl ester carboxylesterase
MGGYIAFAILRAAPERVVKLALLDTAYRADLPEQSERRHKLMAVAREGRFLDINDTLWPLLVHPARQGEAPLRKLIDDMALDVGPEAFIRQQAALLNRPDSTPLLPTIRCPTLVLVGEADALTPPERSDEMAAAIPGAKLVKVPDCGHLSTLERPEAVTKALVEWMQSA